jgi:hypothetical protein
MTLIPCPGCGRSVLDEATNCPQCGYLMGIVPLAEPFEPVPPPGGRGAPRRERRTQAPPPNFKHISVAVVLTLLVVAVGFGALWWLGVLR